MSVSAEWVQLGEKRKKPVFYRKREVYYMEWSDMRLSKYIIAGAPFGGPIAMTKDPKKILQKDHREPHNQIAIYSSSGRLMKTILAESDKGSVIYLCWTELEHLVVVTEEGYIFLYDLAVTLKDGNMVPDTMPIKSFSLPSAVKTERIEYVKHWGSGLVVMTKASHTLFAIADLYDPKPVPLKRTGLKTQPTSIEVIPPDLTLSGDIEVLVAPSKDDDPNGTILVVNSNEIQNQELTTGAYTKMTTSPNGELLASYTENGVLWVVSSDFTKNCAEFNTKSKIPPTQLAWCGEDCVVLYWEPQQLARGDSSLLLMIGPHGDYQRYTYDSPLHLITECDGLRIISNDRCEFLQRVPNSTYEIFRIGSLSPPARLYDAWTEFEEKSANSIKTIRQIKNELLTAVNTCIEAAGYEFDETLQRTLLRAASYGKSFLESYDSSMFVEQCKTLRVLNAVHHFEIGIPLTITQYDRLTPKVLIDRLVSRRHHLLAFRICDYLKMKPEKVLIHWACEKVRFSQLPIDDIIASIKNKLQKSASYSEIAATAYREGKKELALRLLDIDPKAADQVPLLLSMGEFRKALQKATESCDTDLVYLVLLHMKKKMEPPKFYSTINDPKFSLARSLLVAYCKEQDLDFLKVFYRALEMPNEAAMINIVESYKSPTSWEHRMKLLAIAREHFKERKDLQVDAKCTEEQMQLLEIQRELDASSDSGPEAGTSASGQPFVYLNSSLSDTIHHCILTGQDKKAAKLKSDFKVPDKRFWWLKIRALAESGRWEELEKFSKSKKSPIGYVPFVEICLQKGNRTEAANYVPYISDVKERIEYFVTLAKFKEAIEAAAKAKDVDSLRYIYSKSTNQQTRTMIENLLKQLE